ncbi:hypothetical protein [Propionicicella superfundia]|uniref:RipA family octameric membrane protein n=1 Tax=Propionicicella superfundia TaxID=348582 RepID=UPI000421583D|nr:hypothetical protein [Propionicicella superfundia]
MDDAARQRLWEHRQTTNEDFNSISNYFLLAQSFLLLAAVDGMGTPDVARLAVSILGLLLTVLWCYVQAKQRYLLNQLKAECAEEFPEYNSTRASRTHRIWRFSNTAVMAYVIPGLFAVTWLVVLLARVV